MHVSNPFLADVTVGSPPESNDFPLPQLPTPTLKAKYLPACDR